MISIIIKATCPLLQSIAHHIIVLGSELVAIML